MRHCDIAEDPEQHTPSVPPKREKGAFSTMLFELFGNRRLTETCIRFPVCSAEQPAYILKEFGEAWEAAKNSMELPKAREQSKPNPNIRLSKQIRELTERAERATWVRKWIAESRNNWYQLSWKDQKLWQEHDDEDNRRQIAELRSQQQPKFEGASSPIARNMTKQC